MKIKTKRSKTNSFLVILFTTILASCNSGGKGGPSIIVDPPGIATFPLNVHGVWKAETTINRTVTSCIPDDILAEDYNEINFFFYFADNEYFQFIVELSESRAKVISKIFTDANCTTQKGEFIYEYEPKEINGIDYKLLQKAWTYQPMTKDHASTLEKDAFCGLSGAEGFWKFDEKSSPSSYPQSIINMNCSFGGSSGNIRYSDYVYDYKISYEDGKLDNDFIITDVLTFKKEPQK